MAAACQNAGVHYGPEGVSAIDVLLVWLSRVCSNTPAQASKFISIKCVPYCFVLQMAPGFAVFQHFAGLLVNDGQGNRRGCDGVLVGFLLDVIGIVI